MVRIIFNMLIFLGLSATVSCAKKDGRTNGAATSGSVTGSGTNPCLRVVNGKNTSDFPAVVRLAIPQTQGGMGFCTGTFISPVAVVTAAHCLSDGSGGGVAVTFAATIQNGMKAVAALNAFSIGKRGESVDNQTAQGLAEDMAILIFPAGTSKGTLSISTGRPGVGATVTSVGFGLTTLPDLKDDTNFDGSKHYGSEKVVAGDDSINIYTGDATAEESAASGGNDVINSFGDSGSPIIYKNMVAGTLSSGGKITEGPDVGIYQSIFIDINSTKAKNLIETANAAGAAISLNTSTDTSTDTSTNTSTDTGTSGAKASDTTAASPTCLP